MTKEQAALKIKEKHPYPKGEAFDVLFDMALDQLKEIPK